MMNSFAKSESKYINSPAEINEINRIGRSISVAGNINVDQFVHYLY